MALTQYDSPTIPGFQVVIDPATGETFATGNSLARLIEKEPIYIRRHAKTLSEVGTKFQVEKAEVLTTQGLRVGTLYDERFIFSVIKKYKPEMADALSLTATRQLMHRLAGYHAQPVPTQTSGTEAMRQMLALAQNHIAVLEHSSNKPGLQNILDSAIKSEGKCLPGLITVEDILIRDRLFDKVTRGQMTEISVMLAQEYRSTTNGKHPLRQGKNKHCHYPVDFTPNIENAIRYVLNKPEKTRKAVKPRKPRVSFGRITEKNFMTR